MENRDFKGIWIPKDIWLNKELNALDKIIYAEIDSFSSTEVGCIVSNEYLADFCQCSTSKISKAVKKLIELGLIEVVSFDGRHRKIRSRLVKNTMQNNKKYEADCDKVLAINIDNNKDIKNSKCTKHIYGEFKHVRLSDEDINKLNKLTSDIDVWIKKLDEYIEQTGKSYKNHYLTIRNWINKEKPKEKKELNNEYYY